MKVKYKFHWYNKATDEEIELPDDIVFVYVNGDVGRGLHHGYNHYMGCSKTTKKYEDRNGCNIYEQFQGITFFSFHNVIFEDNITIVTPEEFYNMFNLGDYYIFRYVENFGKFLKNKEVSPERLVSISKIIEAKSPYLIKTFTCTLSSWIPSFDNEVLGININDNVELFNLLTETKGRVEVKKNCDKEFTDGINKVLSKVNKKTININTPSNCTDSEIEEAVHDFIEETKWNNTRDFDDIKINQWLRNTNLNKIAREKFIVKLLKQLKHEYVDEIYMAQQNYEKI